MNTSRKQRGAMTTPDNTQARDEAELRQLIADLAHWHWRLTGRENPPTT